MNRFLHKILAFSLSAIVLFTTMSFTLDLHYCGDELVDFSFLQSAETCGMEKPLSENECNTIVTDTACCSDKQIVVDAQDDLKNRPFQKLTPEQQIFVAVFTIVNINLLEGLDMNIIPFRDYKPPLLIRDIQKIHETYLI